MKLKLQQGGALSLPFAVYQPHIIPNDDGTVAVKKKSEDKGMDMEELYKMFKDLQGLPGDVNAVIGTMNQLFGSIEHKLSNPAMYGGTSSITAEYMQLLNLTNSLKFQREQYDKAYDTAVDKGSIHEAAINKYGQVMVLSEEGPSWISPEEYAKNRSEYHLVTNAELLNYRAHGQQGLAFNTEALSIVSEGMGVEQITSLVNNALQSLGKDTQSEQGYVKTRATQLLQGLEDYVKAKDNTGKYDASIEDLYQAKILSENQARSAKQALNYIYSMIPKTGIALLQVKSDGTGEGAKQIIDNLVYSKISTKQELSQLDLKDGPSKSDTSSTTSSVTQSFLTEVQAGRGGHTGRFVLNNRSNNMMATDVDEYESILNLNGQAQLSPTSMDQALKQSGLSSITIQSDIQLGNQTITQQQMRDVLYDGGAFARAELPVIPGTKKINFEILEKLDEFEARVKSLGENPSELLESDKFKDLKPYFNGGQRTKYFAPFLLFNVSTSTGLIDINNKNQFVRDKGADPDLQSDLLYYLSEANPSNPNKYKDLDWKDWKDFGVNKWYDHIYSATLFIPLNMNKQAAIIGGGQRPKFGTDWAEQEYQQSQETYTPVSISNLLN